MENISKSKRVTALTLALVMIFSIIAGALSSISDINTVSAATETAKLTVGDTIYYGQYSTRYFTATLTSDNTKYVGYCAQAELYTPQDGTYEVVRDYYKLANQNASEEYIYAATNAVLYYGYGGPGFDESMWPSTYNGDAWTDDMYAAMTHVMLSQVYVGTINYALSGLGSDTAWVKWNILGRDDNKELANTDSIFYKIRALRNESVLNGMDVFAVHPGDSTVQDILVWRYTAQTGDLNLVKTSANTSITSGNSCYSLEGAVYGVYSDSTCSTKVGEIKTDANGKGSLTGLTAGTYYVKGCETLPYKCRTA